LLGRRCGGRAGGARDDPDRRRRGDPGRARGTGAAKERPCLEAGPDDGELPRPDRRRLPRRGDVRSGQPRSRRRREDPGRRSDRTARDHRASQRRAHLGPGAARDQPWRGRVRLHGDAMIVRLERVDDRPASMEVERAAFPTAEEATIVERVRDEPGSFALVAELDGAIIGHVQLSAAWIGDAEVLALGPIGVRPDDQGRGAGSTLIREALSEAARRGAAAVILLGSPTYYG